MPSADFCRPVRFDHSFLSPDSRTDDRSPEVSSTTFDAQPPDLHPVSLMDMRFAVICQLARHPMPCIRFLFIGSRLCSTLLSDPPSPERPCASLPFTSIRLGRGLSPRQSSNMLGTQKIRGERRESLTASLASRRVSCPRTRAAPQTGRRAVRPCRTFHRHA